MYLTGHRHKSSRLPGRLRSRRVGRCSRVRGWSARPLIGISSIGQACVMMARDRSRGQHGRRMTSSSSPDPSTALVAHPVHPMHPLLRTCPRAARRHFLPGIPMRTARKTKEAASPKKVKLIRVSNIRVTFPACLPVVYTAGAAGHKTRKVTNQWRRMGVHVTAAVFRLLKSAGRGDFSAAAIRFARDRFAPSRPIPGSFGCTVRFPRHERRVTRFEFIAILFDRSQPEIKPELRSGEEIKTFSPQACIRRILSPRLYLNLTFEISV